MEYSILMDLKFTPDRIRRLRGSLTQEKFAKELGVTIRTISYWESKGRQPRDPVVLARLLAIEQNPV